MRNRRAARFQVWYVCLFAGTEYRFGNDKFGGDDPVMGFDCSGIVTESERALGYLPYNARMNCQMFWDQYVAMGCRVKKPKMGCYALYGKDEDHVSHMGICMDNTSLIQAGGGDSRTKDEERAAERNAFVQVRPIHYRGDLLGFMDPHLKVKR